MSESSAERWARIEAIVDQALDLPPETRSEFVRNASGGDAELHEAAMEWLEACDNPSLVPDTPAAVFAAPLLTHGDATTGRHDLDMQQIGPYGIVRELGRGGMGAVYLAERVDGELDRRVAVKLMRRGTGDDARLRKRFRDERQILARLEHPHIATLIDGGVTPDGRLYFVMQYIEGVPIDRYCAEHALSVEARLRLFLGVCAAVQHAHRHQIVHRDLKPGNILVTRDGQAKLLDFGIAKLLEPEAPHGAEQTRTGERLLTPEYASPEQIRGESVTPASDVHALGVLLHVLLTGQRPFVRKARTPYELERAILDEEPTQPSDAVTDPAERRRLRGDLDAIVLTALRKNASERYSDAGEFAADIERHLSGHAVQARGRAPAYRLRTLAGRHRRSLAAIGAGILLGASAFAVWLTRGPPRASRVTGAVFAIGRISDYRDGADRESVAPLVDMLATNLARTKGLAVISAGRMYDLVHNTSGAEQTAEDWARAARIAGATEVVNGAIYSAPGGGVRLDLQRVDVASGAILGAHTAIGADLFSLADSATFELVVDLGLAAPAGSIADVTTRSLAAYRHYTDGLRSFYAGRVSEADSSLAAALREDSTFAMAAYYQARNSPYEWRFASATTAERRDFEDRLTRALRLAAKAGDRERLLIRAFYEAFHLSPAVIAVAETLTVRYPQEVEGHMMLGMSLALEGKPVDAIKHYERVLVMDSASLRSGADRCAGCVAINALIESTVLMDSLARAEGYARRWFALQPDSPGARVALVQTLDGQGRYAEASALLVGGPAGGSTQDSVLNLAKHWIRAGAPGTADTLLLTWIGRVSGQARAPLLYFRAIVLRDQRRRREALVVARQLRSLSGDRASGNAAPPSALVEAQMLFELGQLREATALFDSVARWPSPGQPPSARATLRVQALSMVAASLHAAGDTARLAALADSIEAEGRQALMFRPRDQHYFVRGLLYESRGDTAGAVTALEHALGGVTADFSRANLLLSRLHMRAGRTAEATATLRRATRGWFLETTNLHASLTDVHERLAEAFDAAGLPDSAAAHRRRVAQALAPSAASSPSAAPPPHAPAAGRPRSPTGQRPVRSAAACAESARKQPLRRPASCDSGGRTGVDIIDP